MTRQEETSGPFVLPPRETPQPDSSTTEEGGRVLYIINHLAQAFAGRFIKRAVVQDDEAIFVFDPPNHREIDLRRASYIRAVDVGGQRYEIVGVDEENSIVTSEKAEKPAVPGMPILVLSLKTRVETRKVADSSAVTFYTPFGEIRVPGTTL